MIIFFIFLLGTAVGSFLNVLIYRLPREEEVVKKRSHCTSCGTPLLWYDLIPLFSFVKLCGKCRYCRSKISWQYPIIELVTGGLFVLGYLGSLGYLGVVENHMPIGSITSTNYSIGFVWFILSALLVIFVVDLKHYIIPDKILFPAIAVTLLYQFRIWNLESGSMGGELISNIQYLISNLPAVNFILSSLLTAGFFLFLVLITKGKGMGLGDVKFGAFMGLLLGFPSIVVALYAAFLTGAVVSVLLLLLGRKKFGQVVPFGPFLVVGTIVGLYYGERLWTIVWNLV